MLDLLIRGGLVLDGSGRSGHVTDVGVQDGRVVAVEPLAEAAAAGSAAHVVDASGLVVAPGFVDVHSHSDATLLLDPRARSALAQGVTTEVVGNCGHGCAPMGERSRYAGNIYGYTPELPLDWTTQAGYLARLQAARPALNVAALVPNGNLRLAVVGLRDRPATVVESAQMQRLLAEALEEGAFGYSTGLEYPLERGCSAEEIGALARVAAHYGALYATHTRNREAHAAAAVDEAVRTARRAEVRLQVSHIIPRAGGPHDALERCVAALDAAAGVGVDASFDIHTRLFGVTNLSAALPPWALAGTSPEIAARLRDPATRVRLRAYPSLIASFLLAGSERVCVLDAPSLPAVRGRDLADLSAGGDPYDPIFDILAAEADAGQVHRPMCICWSYDEQQLAWCVGHRRCMVASDATTLAPDGPLATQSFHGAYTWAAWFLRRLVRERGELGLPEAVRRLTSLPARQVGLKDRGCIRLGAWADLVVFDPSAVQERGTVEAPNQLAEGMVHVAVNGQLVIEGGRFTAARPGAVLRRGAA